MNILNTSDGTNTVNGISSIITEERYNTLHISNRFDTYPVYVSTPPHDLSVLLNLNHYYCPSNLDLPALLAARNLHFWMQPKCIEGLYFIISYILYQYCNGVKRCNHVNMSASLLNRRLGKSPQVKGKRFDLYKQAIGVLCELRIIHQNRSYRFGDDKSKNFTMSYALTPHYAYGDFKIISFKAKTPPADKSEIKNDIQGFILRNLRKLRLDESKLTNLLNSELPADTRLLIDRAADNMRKGKLNVRGGSKQRRVYHVLTQCPRELRAAVTLKGKDLVEVDIPSCQPVLLLSLCADIPRDEVERYKDILANDIYLALGDGNRQRAKNDFLPFAFRDYSGKSFADFAALNADSAFASNFIKDFPNIARAIHSFNGSLSCYLQDLEAEICIYTVAADLMRRGVFAVPIHDGYLIEPKDYELVNVLVAGEILKRFNFNMALKVKV